ncbi:MAG: transketolase C-terminal domain-containing protein, partial [Acidimicrobiales bacterium]
DEVLAHYRAAGQRGSQLRAEWEKRRSNLGEKRDVYEASFGPGGLPGWESAFPDIAADTLATRQSSNKCLQALAPFVPALIAGSADLTGNTGTRLSDTAVTPESPGCRQIHFGVREHAMGAIMNGLALHGGFLPVGGTFLMFSDYMRPSVRLAALSGAHVIYSFTHYSVGVGEDGPTHQPIEHLAALRTIPNLNVIRPADSAETIAAWRVAIAHDGPTALLLTRQAVPALEGTGNGLAQGAYVLRDAKSPDITLIGTGSELQHCVAAADSLTNEGLAARVVSMPSWNLFENQDRDYKMSVLPRTHPTLSIEAGVSVGWWRYADEVISIERYGASAPGDRVMAELGMTAANVADTARRLIASSTMGTNE